GVLLDIVPNHMTTALANPWWRDVLTRGPFSERAQYFDLSPLAEDEPWKIRICTLGRRYGRVLEESEFSLDLESPEPQLAYFDHRWPLCPLSWVLLDGADADLRREAEALRAVVAPTDEDRTRYRDLEARIRRWYQENRDTLREAAKELAKNPDELHRLIEQQYYRLAWWKLAGELVNYRRFFNIGSLVGLRVEDPEVFRAAHGRIERMVADDPLDGLRVDHPDGLRDPAGYLADLRRLIPEGRIYVEQIMDAEEPLPAGWAVD